MRYLHSAMMRHKRLIWRVSAQAFFFLRFHVRQAPVTPLRRRHYAAADYVVAELLLLMVLRRYCYGHVYARYSHYVVAAATAIDGTVVAITDAGNVR